MSNANRSIRIGILYRGNIIHEELFDRRIDISIGRRAGSTILVSSTRYPDFPEFIDLLVCENGQYSLVVSPDPSVRINLRGETNPGEPRTVKRRRAIPIDAVAAGSVHAGDVTVMFQFVRSENIALAQHESTVLRLGLVYNDRLIDDRIFPDTKTVSVGNARDCTIVLPDDDYQGPSLTFTNNKDGSVSMRAPGNMKIRLAVDGSPMELKDLLAKGKARQEGNDLVCHLSLGTRGRATMGAQTLMFQVVKRAFSVPAMPKRSLPESVVAGILGEPAWWISFSVSVLLIIGVIFQAHYFEKTTNKFLKARAEEQDQKGSYDVIVEVKEEIKEEPKEEEKKPTVDVMSEKAKEEEKKEVEKKREPDKKADAKAEAKADKPQAAGEKVDPTVRKEQVRAAIAEKTIAKAFQSPGAGAATKMYGDADSGEAADYVAKGAFGNATGDGKGEGDKGPGAGGVKLSGSTAGATVERVKAGKTSGFGERKADDVKPKGPDRVEEKITIKMDSDTSGSGEAKADVAKVISRKNSAVQRCYEQALRDNPDVGGKVKVTFTVGTEGTITDVSVSGASGSFAECIKAKFEAIRGLPTLSSPQTFGQSYVFSKGGG